MKNQIKRLSKTMDGNQAAAHVAYAFTEVAAIYPITPSSAMAEHMDEWAAGGLKNIFGHPVTLSQMQSEAGAAGAMHGALVTGALSTTFTASQGLLLMIPNLYRMAGELLPGVLHVAARTLATHALSIFGDHSDIYACRQTGAAIFATCNVQEIMDLTPVVHMSALRGRIPFLHFFDGFRTSHEIQKIEVWDYETLKELVDMEALQGFRKNCLHPASGKLMGSAQNPDIFFQNREACNTYYQALPHIVEEKLQQVNDLLGTNYGLFEYSGHKEAEHVIIAMGSVCETIEETINSLNTADIKAGVVKVRLYRPFSISHFLKVLPKTVKKITVLDRTKEPGATGEPLYLDILAALKDSAFSHIPVFRGRYGLSSKDTTPSQILAILNNHDKEHFTIGINDDVTHLSLPITAECDPLPKDTYNCMFWGLGGDGTVSANKSSVKIIGDHTALYAQAYFDYDSKKSRGLTTSHLRFGKKPIRAPYLVQKADFVACHNPVYLHKYDMVQSLKDGGIFLLNCYWQEKDLDQYIPGQVKRYIAEHHIKLYIIDAIAIGKEIGLNNKISTILQAAFFSLMKLLPAEEAIRLMKEAAAKSYAKKGDDILQMNYQAIERGMTDVRQVHYPASWVQATPEPLDEKLLPDRKEVLDYVTKLQKPITAQKGNDLPVSAFLPYVDGSFPAGTTAHERRNTATEIPVWKPENCIQCNLCSYVCPHAVIRPAALTTQEKENAPEGMKTLPMNGMTGDNYHFAITVSEVDCTGCGSCAGVCPGKMGKKALEMTPIHEKSEHQEYFDYGKSLPVKPEILEVFKENTVKGSQMRKPLLEFHGACAGCGETTYPRLITQLFGERMYIANATGCSSIWANSSPSTAYTVGPCGCGPAWSNSLFEDAAEFGYGMLLANKTLRSTEPLSHWVFGGDGFAYDIGYGGLDHILASGADINILIMDTEVYSNTGGQASKATPVGASAKFTTDGKSTRKKDLSAMAMTYGDIYVAQIAMGADYNQTLRTILEAESYKGPSLIIAYSPCISHGIKSGMGSSQQEEAKAVKTGYWHLFRYNPRLIEQGENPFILDSKAPTLDYDEFLRGETRYTALQKVAPENAKELFEQAKTDAAKRYERLLRLREFYEPQH